MEQIQSPVIENPKKPVGLQIAALILGIVGFCISFFLAACKLWDITWTNAFPGGDSPFRFAESLSPVLTVSAVLLGLVAIVLAIIGLSLSLRKPRRPLGIVLSAIGLLFGASALLFLLFMAFWSTWLPSIFQNFPK